MDFDKTAKKKSNRRGSFVALTMPKTAHQRGLSCIRIQQSDLFKAQQVFSVAEPVPCYLNLPYL